MSPEFSQISAFSTTLAEIFGGVNDVIVSEISKTSRISIFFLAAAVIV